MLLGSVPDIDVLIDRIASSRLHADSSRDGGIPDRDGAQGRRRRHQAELVDGLGSPRYVELVDVLIGTGAAPPLADQVDGERRARRPFRKHARKTWRRVARGGATG
jgi:hypothetical protein